MTDALAEEMEILAKEAENSEETEEMEEPADESAEDK